MNMPYIMYYVRGNNTSALPGHAHDGLITAGVQSPASCTSCSSRVDIWRMRRHQMQSVRFNTVQRGRHCEECSV